MLLVLGLAAAIWALGAAMKAPLQARWTMVGLLFVAVLALHIVLPDGHPVRMATGQSAALWLILAAGVGVVLAYREVLKRLKERVSTKNTSEPAHDGPFTDTELNRYARHIVLREIGGVGQKSLRDARVLVIGAGGLGAPALQYLGAAGVGTIGVIDDDLVENANLQRQVIHKDSAIGTPKVFSAKEALLAQNPFLTVRPYNRRFSEEIARDLLEDYDILLDGTDNFETRYLANRNRRCRGHSAYFGRAEPVGRTDQRVRSQDGWPLLPVHFPAGACARTGTELCRGRSAWPPARCCRRDDGRGMHQADHARRGADARGDADLRRALRRNPPDRAETPRGLSHLWHRPT